MRVIGVLLAVCLALLSATATAQDALIVPESHSPWHPTMWEPKLPGGDYKPQAVDWSSVISACRATGQYEWRLFTYFIRTAFHDGMAVDATACAKQVGAEEASVAGETSSMLQSETSVGEASIAAETSSGDMANVTVEQAPHCSGLDGSIFTMAEIMRPENKDFAAVAGLAVIRIASLYDASVADVIAVCAAVAIEEMSQGKVHIIGNPKHGFKVGRHDSLEPSPPGQLPGGSIDLATFAEFWKRHDFTLDEAMALMGSHSLLQDLGCSKSAVLGDDCMPRGRDTCVNIRKFRWSNDYYHDVCTPSVKIVDQPWQAKPYQAMDDAEYGEALKNNLCKFTSPEFRQRQWDDMWAQRQGRMPQPVKWVEVEWPSDGCDQAMSWGVAAEHCPHRSWWPYTKNDAWLGLACMGQHDGSSEAKEVEAAMREYIKSPDNWDREVEGAYTKMAHKYSKWHPSAAIITGEECPSGMREQGGRSMCSTSWLDGKLILSQQA